MKERSSLYKEQDIRLLDRWLTNNNIEYVFFDSDGTLINTRITYHNAMREACGILTYQNKWETHRNDPESKVYKKAELIASSIMGPLISSYRDKYFVTPAVMLKPTLEIAKMNGLHINNPYTELAVRRIRRLYNSDGAIPFDGAFEAVNVFRETGRICILSTHASTEYVESKYSKNELKMFNGRMWLFRTDMPKSIQWNGFFEEKKVDPKKSIIIGDNLPADLIQPILLGAWGIWINQGRKIGFSPEKHDEELIQQILSSPKLIQSSDISFVVPKLASLAN